MSNQPPERFSLTDRDYPVAARSDRGVRQAPYSDWVPGPFEPERQGDPSDFRVRVRRGTGLRPVTS